LSAVYFTCEVIYIAYVYFTTKTDREKYIKDRQTKRQTDTNKPDVK